MGYVMYIREYFGEQKLLGYSFEVNPPFPTDMIYFGVSTSAGSRECAC